MMIKKSIFIISLILLAVVGRAAEIKFMDNPKWTEVLERAKKENKIIFLDAYAVWCGPCKQMEADIYTNQAVADFYNANFINVKYDMEKGEGPMLADRFFVNAYPNLIFISPEGVMLHKGIGFMESEKFISLGKNALQPEKQYYIQKKKAKQMDSKSFLAFAKQATVQQDEDLVDIAENYLATQKDILGDSYLIDLIMNYAHSLPSEKDIVYFKENKTRVLREGKYTDDDFQNRLASLVMGYGLSEKVQIGDELDFDVLKSLLDKYVPEQSFMALNFYKIQYFLDNKDNASALQVMHTLLENNQQLEYETICNAMIAFAPIFFNEEEKFNVLLQKFSNLKLPVNEEKLDYLKDLTYASIYVKTGQTEKFKERAKLILANKNTPGDLKKEIESALSRLEQKEK